MCAEGSLGGASQSEDSNEGGGHRLRVEKLVTVE